MSKKKPCPPPAPRGNKRAVGNRGGRGGPQKYHADFIQECHDLALLGKTNAEIAGIIEVGESTIEGWCRDHPEFAKALRAGKAIADGRVARSFFQRAVGYEHEAVKIFNNDGNPLVVPYIERYPPDTAAGRFWLSRRQQYLWPDRETDDAQTGPPAVFQFIFAPIQSTRDERDPYGKNKAVA